MIECDGEFKIPNELTIVGNGFDLAIGALTSYYDFYTCLKECFYADKKTDFMKKYHYNSNDIIVSKFYDLVDNNRDNYFINYFLKYNNIFGDWVAFEKELTKIIINFDKLISRLKSFDKMNIGQGNICYVNVGDEIDLLHILNVHSNNNFFDADMFSLSVFYKDCVRFSIKGKKSNDYTQLLNDISIFLEEFPLMLYKDLILFSNLFSIYLGIVYQNAKIESKIINSFKKSFFVNYNYTNYLKRVLMNNNYYSDGVLYINGVVEDFSGDLNNKIVFGIDSNVSLTNIGFEVFTKRIQRSIINTEISKLNNILESAIFECINIYGHSLNNADYESLHFIFLKCSAKSKPTIVTYYYNEDAKVNLIINIKKILGDEIFDEYQREGKLLFINSNKIWIK